MELKLLRHTYTDKSTISSLYHGKTFLCYFLEDPVRKTKIFGETAIPTGRYPIEVSYSPRFKRLMPMLLNVPKFSGIRVHTGNYPKDTEGCPLPGMQAGKDVVLQSAVALKFITEYIEKTLPKSEGLWVTIEEVIL